MTIYEFTGNFTCKKCGSKTERLYTPAPDVWFAIGMIRAGSGLCKNCFDNFADFYHIQEWPECTVKIPVTWELAEFLIGSANDFAKFTTDNSELSAIYAGLEKVLLNGIKVPKRVYEYIEHNVSPEDREYARAEFALRRAINDRCGYEFISLDYEAVFYPFLKNKT